MDSNGPASVHVLCVDDDPDFLTLTATVLESESDSLTVLTETDPRDALARLERGEDVDCIVSDYQMPGIDGLEFLDAVRETDPYLPFILFTGRGSEEIASDAISAGVTEYLQKGHGSDQYVLLANRIENAAESYRAQRELERKELLFDTLFGDSSLFLGIMEPDGTLVYANDGALSLVGAELAEVRGQPLWETPWWSHAGELQEEVRTWIRRAAEGDRTCFHTVDCNLDEQLAVEGLVRPVTDEGEVVKVIAEAWDTTERKQGLTSV